MLNFVDSSADWRTDIERVLIVEDSAPLALACTEFLKAHYITETAADLSRARAVLGSEPPDALILDIQLPDGSGLDLLAELREQDQALPIIVMTSDGSVENAVSAMQNGADDFLEKPFSAERLRTTVANVLKQARLTQLVDSIEQESRDRFEGFIGASLPMQAVYHMVESAAPSKATVFITGESGTGKEVMARAIHDRSPRKRKPFIAINCGAIPSELIESEVFGHIKGAFTGANKERKGAAQQADGGTLFLDELCEMDLELQVKLLRFLQTERFRPVGSDSEVEVDVRIVCATNRHPMEEVKAGRFREDLYYRLHVISIEMPPLRERGTDVQLIAESLLLQYAEEENKSFRGFSREAAAVLSAYPWPGNVREMQNIVRQIVVLNDAEDVQINMLPPALTAGAAVSAEPASAPESIPLTPEPVPVPDEAPPVEASAPFNQERNQELNDESAILPLWKMEELHIERALAACDGSIPRAAGLLEVSPSTLYRKLGKK